MRKAYKKLKQAESKYDSAKGAMSAILSDNIKFEFSIVDLAGDGFTILSTDTDRVCPLERCIEAIEEKGEFTEEDMGRFTF